MKQKKLKQFLNGLYCQELFDFKLMVNNEKQNKKFKFDLNFV